MKEQRTHKRIPVHLKAAYRNRCHLTRIGRVSNISRGGMFILTDETPDEINSYFLASIDVEEFGKVVWVHGRIVRQDLSGVAVRFTRSDDRGLDMLLSYRGVPF